MRKHYTNAELDSARVILQKLGWSTCVTKKRLEKSPDAKAAFDRLVETSSPVRVQGLLSYVRRKGGGRVVATRAASVGKVSRDPRPNFCSQCGHDLRTLRTVCSLKFCPGCGKGL